jgi:hypothetical protein
MQLVANLPVAGDYPRGGRHRLKTHWTACMELLIRDSNLGPKAHLLSIGKPRRGIDHNRSTVRERDKAINA